MTSSQAPAKPGSRRAQNDPLWVQALLITLGVGTILFLVLIPVIYVFVQAFAEGVGKYFESLFGDPDTRHALLLSLSVVPVVIVLNSVFGIAAAWVITRFSFPGKVFLTSLIDLPFAISPVVAGLMLMLLFGLQGIFGPTLERMGVSIVFAWPGIVLATMFVTLPFIARELIPVMEAIGSEEEQAAVSLGAKGWQMFWHVTLPNISWGLLYGIILCNARAWGEYGAVYVVSGRISGETDTLPLRIEKLMQDYDNTASFAVASLLTFLAVVTLILKTWLEHRRDDSSTDDATEAA